MVGGFFNTPQDLHVQGLWDGAFGLLSLSKKIRNSNLLQMCLQRQCLLLSYLKTLRAKYLNEVYLKLQFNKSLDLKISSLVGCFKKINAFLVFSICFHKTVHNKWCLDKIVGQIENDLEICGFVKHWLNYV